VRRATGAQKPGTVLARCRPGRGVEVTAAWVQDKHERFPHATFSRVEAYASVARPIPRSA